MGKCGRPRKHGVRPGWMIYRATVVLYAYNQVRSAGQKHSVALREAVATVRSLFPTMPISETEAKRILAEFQAQDASTALTVQKGSGASIEIPPEVCRKLGIPEGKRLYEVYSVGYGPSENRVVSVCFDESAEAASVSVRCSMTNC